MGKSDGHSEEKTGMGGMVVAGIEYQMPSVYQFLQAIIVCFNHSLPSV